MMNLFKMQAKAKPLVKPSTPEAIQGLMVPGNINLFDRPQVRNPDGSVSTVRSMSFGRNGQEILIPTVHPSGYVMSDQDAIRHYDQTGQHLGIFKDPRMATAYAEWLHNQYAAGRYNRR